MHHTPKEGLPQRRESKKEKRKQKRGKGGGSLNCKKDGKGGKEETVIEGEWPPAANLPRLANNIFHLWCEMKITHACISKVVGFTNQTE